MGTPKRKRTQKIYHLDEEEIQDLIAKAKEGDSGAQARMLEVFDNFLTKYVSLLYHAKLDVDNVNIRRFLALYIPDSGVRYHLKGNKLNSAGYRYVMETLEGLQYMVQRYGNETDTKNTIQLTFLETIQRYKRKESKQGGWVPFSGYLNNYYHYLLKNNVDAYLIDQNGRNSFPFIQDNMDDDENEIMHGFELPSLPSAEELIGPDEIDEEWVAGYSALHPFDELTIQDRQLIKWRYIDGLKTSEIARRITEHPNTVRVHFNKIKEKVTTIMGDDLNF